MASAYAASIIIAIISLVLLVVRVFGIEQKVHRCREVKG